MIKACRCRPVRFGKQIQIIASKLAPADHAVRNAFGGLQEQLSRSVFTGPLSLLTKLVLLVVATHLVD